MAASEFGSEDTLTAQRLSAVLELNDSRRAMEVAAPIRVLHPTTPYPAFSAGTTNLAMIFLSPEWSKSIDRRSPSADETVP